MALGEPGPAFTDVMVGIVTPGSAGQDAGLEPGDVILSLGGRSDLTLSEARGVQTEDGPLEVVYLRGDDQRQTVLQRRPNLPVPSDR